MNPGQAQPRVLRYSAAMVEKHEPGSDAVTEGIRVRVKVAFVPEHSRLEPEKGPLLYVHAYTVTVTNDGPQTATLVARHWVLTDADGREEHVRGPGVVGLQPSLGQGQAFTYTSSAALVSPTGTMHGEYLMEWDNGVRFQATIAPFALVVPGVEQ